MEKTIPKKESGSRQKSLFASSLHIFLSNFPLAPKEATISSLLEFLPIVAQNAGNVYWSFLSDVLYFKQNLELQF